MGTPLYLSTEVQSLDSGLFEGEWKGVLLLVRNWAHTPLPVYGGPVSLNIWILTSVRGPNQTSKH